MIRFLINSSIVIGCYVIAVVCSIKIVNELRRSTKDMSKSTREMNKQLSMLLFVQVSF
jgi:hypothetical protein